MTLFTREKGGCARYESTLVACKVVLALFSKKCKILLLHGGFDGERAEPRGG
jgi:hypothetical protein